MERERERERTKNAEKPECLRSFRAEFRVNFLECCSALKRKKKERERIRQAVVEKGFKRAGSWQVLCTAMKLFFLYLLKYNANIEGRLERVRRRG